MAEQNANLGPRYATRLSDLERWHVLTAVPPSPALRLWRLLAGRPRYTHLTEVEATQRCQRCGNREGDRVLVTMA